MAISHLSSDDRQTGGTPGTERHAGSLIMGLGLRFLRWST